MAIELIGVLLILISIIYSFYKKNERLGFCFIIILFTVLYLLYGTT